MTGIALLGAGFMARTHAAVYASLPDRAEVRVVCATGGADAIADQFGAAVTDDWEAAIATPGVDAVDICRPTPLHRPAADRALAAGRHVLLEKPIALTLEDADAIGAAAGGRHVRAIVEHEGGDATVEGSHAMPPSFPFTAGLRVLCERGVLHHRFVAGAGDEVADDAAASALSIHPAAGEAERFERPGDRWSDEIRHFLDCVETGAEPTDGSFAQAPAALAIAVAARRSIETGEPEPAQ